MPSEVLSAILPVPGSVASAGPAANFPFDCQYCGNIEEGHYSADTKRALLARHACFNCNFWLAKAATHSYPSTAPTSREPVSFCYLNSQGEITHFIANYCPNPPTASQKRSHSYGFGAAHFCLLFRDGTTYTSYDVWHQGTVPDIFRHLFTPHVINLHHK